MIQPSKKIAYASLPADIKRTFESTDIDDAITAIGAQFKLHVDQVGVLYTLTNGVMTGQVPPSEFIQMLATNVKIDHEKAAEIAKAVNEKVFLAVRESLKKIHEVGKEPLARQAVPLEKKKDVLQAIESPESVPMRTRVFEPTPEPIKEVRPASSEPTPPAQNDRGPTSIIEPVPVPVPATPPPPPKKAFDPYREAAV